MRLAGLSDLEAANRYLEETFLPELNRQFTVKPKRKADVHRSVPRGVRLGQVLSLQETRVVQNDWTVRWRHRRFQLTAANQKLALVRQSVLVCERLDGSLALVFRGRELAWEEITEQASTSPANVPQPTAWDELLSGPVPAILGNDRSRPPSSKPPARLAPLRSLRSLRCARRAEERRTKTTPSCVPPKPRGHFY